MGFSYRILMFLDLTVGNTNSLKGLKKRVEKSPLKKHECVVSELQTLHKTKQCVHMERRTNKAGLGILSQDKRKLKCCDAIAIH